MGTHLCPDGEINLQGNFDSEVFKYVKLAVNKCLDDTQCYSEEELSQLVLTHHIPYFIMQFRITGYVLDPFKNKGITPYINSDINFPFLPNKFISEANVFLTKTIFDQDTSILPFVKEEKKLNLVSINRQNVQSTQVELRLLMLMIS